MPEKGSRKQCRGRSLSYIHANVVPYPGTKALPLQPLAARGEDTAHRAPASTHSCLRKRSPLLSKGPFITRIVWDKKGLSRCSWARNTVQDKGRLHFIPIRPAQKKAP